jgi:hypothetical protein
VAGEGVEIAVEVLHVDGHVHGGLGAVDQHGDAAGVRAPHHLLDGHDGAQHVGHMRDGHHPRALAQQRLELVDQELAAVGDRRPLQHAALALAVEVPGHDVGMVLHDREHDLVALPEVRAEGARDQVDRVRQVAGEDDLLHRRRIEEAAHGLARVLEAGGGGVGEEVQAAMHVGVFHLVGVVDGVENRARLLRGGAVVEIDERLAVDLAE